MEPGYFKPRQCGSEVGAFNHSAVQLRDRSSLSSRSAEEVNRHCHLIYGSQPLLELESECSLKELGKFV